jgi:hypothetical protein
MFWNNQVGKEKEREKRREKKMCVLVERTERLSILLDTLSERQTKKIIPTNAMLLLLYILMHLAGSLVAFDTTTENYTVSVSGKCVLTCYVSEIRSFKVSQSY